MIAEKPVFWDYLIVDEDGFVNGIADDAPDEAKKAYEKYKEKQEQNRKNGIKE